MVLKIFKAVWFLSLLSWLLVFLYVYASLPEEVLIRDPDNYRAGSRVMISREGLFYILLAAITLFTALVLTVRRLYNKEDFLTWFYGLFICLHFFFVIVLNFINLINSGENFDYNRIGNVIYGSVALFALWAVAWPVYAIFKKFLSKEAV